MREQVTDDDRRQFRQWIENWRVVNAVQDELTRAEGPGDPAANLAKGISMIALFAPSRQASGTDLEETDRQHLIDAWSRLRAAYAK